jgi:hypothetical protein
MNAGSACTDNGGHHNVAGGVGEHISAIWCRSENVRCIYIYIYRTKKVCGCVGVWVCVNACAACAYELEQMCTRLSPLFSIPIIWCLQAPLPALQHSCRRFRGRLGCLDHAVFDLATSEGAAVMLVLTTLLMESVCSTACARLAIG